MGHLPERQLRGREGDEFAIVRKVDNVYPIELKVQGHVPEVSGVDGQRRANKTDSPGTSRGGQYDRCGEGKKGNQGGVDDLVLATRSPIIQGGGGISTERRERDGHYRCGKPSPLGDMGHPSLRCTSARSIRWVSVDQTFHRGLVRSVQN